MGRRGCQNLPLHFVLLPGEVMHLQLDSGMMTRLDTLWIQKEATLYLYGRRYVDSVSSLQIQTLIIDEGGVLYVVPGDSEYEPLLLRLGPGSLNLLPPEPALSLLKIVLKKDEQMYKFTHSASSVASSTFVLSARGLLNATVRFSNFGY